MNAIEIVQMIGCEVCEDCGPDSDCGEYPETCGRVTSAVKLLETHFKPIKET